MEFLYVNLSPSYITLLKLGRPDNIFFVSGFHLTMFDVMPNCYCYCFGACGNSCLRYSVDYSITMSSGST